MKATWTLSALASVTTMIALPAHAEYFGLASGRTADLGRLPDVSVEAGVMIGDIYDFDYQQIGARINYRIDPLLMVYGDFGLTDIEDADGNTFGVGAFYVMEGIFEGSDFALKGSYHRGSVDEDGFETDLDAITVEGLFSGREPFGANDNLRWYANVGIHRLSSDSEGGSDDSETEFGFGGGVVVPTAQGEFYVGLDLIDEMTFGGGFRYFLQ